MSRYLDVVNRVAASYAHAKTAKTAKTGSQISQISQISHSRPLPLPEALSVLQSGCPAHVEVADWKCAIADGVKFLSSWGEQAEALGWTARDLFGLAPVPDRPAPTFRRLSRYDLTGLIWLLRGRQVVALTASSAAIQGPSGAVTVCQKVNKPALGPLGDSLADFDGVSDGV
jgi:hypothetical protein